MRLVLFLLWLPLLVFVVYFIVSAFKYTRMISNIFMSLVYRPKEESYSSSVGENVTILDSGDHETAALLVEKKDSKKVVIFCHESGAGKESWEKYGYFLPSLGYHVLAFDFRQKPFEVEQNSLSQWPTEEDVENLLRIIHWSKRALRPDIEVVLFGVSNGADIALEASFRDDSVTAVVADGLFSMKEIFRDYIRRWAPILVKPNLFGEKYPAWVVNLFTNLGFWYSQEKAGRRFVDVEKLLRRRHPALLVIHGEEDDYVPTSHQRFLEQLNRGRMAFRHLVVPAARHNQSVLVGRELYEKTVADFLRELTHGY
jgi:pimeloyl-ACP methyl ester carboxylesterase